MLYLQGRQNSNLITVRALKSDCRTSLIAITKIKQFVERKNRNESRAIRKVTMDRQLNVNLSIFNTY